VGPTPLPLTLPPPQTEHGHMHGEAERDVAVGGTVECGALKPGADAAELMELICEMGDRGDNDSM